MTGKCALVMRRRAWRDLIPARDGIAITEFALVLPVFVIMLMGGAELTNYMTVRMRVSQLALHLADNGSRLGDKSALSSKQISEAQINDMLAGANLQAGALDLRTNARVIVSSLEPVANPNPTNKYKIAWQRCYGTKTYSPIYGKEGDTNLTGMGPAGRQVTAMDDGSTIFVELNYQYKPLVRTKAVTFGEFTEIAAMAVRDPRDLSQIYNNPVVAKSTC